MKENKLERLPWQWVSPGSPDRGASPRTELSSVTKGSPEDPDVDVAPPHRPCTPMVLNSFPCAGPVSLGDERLQHLS